MGGLVDSCFTHNASSLRPDSTIVSEQIFTKNFRRASPLIARSDLAIKKMCFNMLMPSRNILRLDAQDAYYHVYGRGVNKRRIYLDKQDYAVFMNLLKRYLGSDEVHDTSGRPYHNYSKQVDLVAFCLMPNHFHFLIYQVEVGALMQLMKAILTSYSRYFNTKYERRGPLFESRYKAAIVYNDAYLQHISRYIHLNPVGWRRYPYSSLRYFLGTKQTDWVKPGRILAIFEGDDYLKFVEDYQDYKKQLDFIKDELADS